MPAKSHLDRAQQIAAERRVLRALCDESAPRGPRLELLQSYAAHAFLEPEHQVVFESIRYLFSKNAISPARLNVHLNNRGFPDIDIDSYFPSTPAGGAAREGVNKENP